MAKDPLILITFLLDRSGSMEPCREATISGFNEFKNDQARAPGRTLFSLTTFNTDFTIDHAAVPAASIPDLTPETYAPEGCTALYDAVGWTIKNLEDKLRALGERPDKNLFVIMTDGQENSSKEFNRAAIFALIEAKRAENWEFVFLGANQDAYAAGAALGVPIGSTTAYAATPTGTREAFRSMGANTVAYRSSNTGDPANSGNFFGAAGRPDPQMASRAPKTKKRKHERL